MPEMKRDVPAPIISAIAGRDWFYKLGKEKGITIEALRSQLRGIFDPQLVFLFFMLANPAASHGECARGDSNQVIIMIITSNL